ncbi:hypothetical protein CDD80_6240 [Ophiocordyceps camponoti-rufipedis]|uniref:Uncharacterized protein n=1 Tax=Ophiocordyceps camponoti-rufipedis TaxID=2004952 RepID=A0A2C5ZH78_9HYPO|nr:hypothetical protein CDD80_6240 [Ophiocordyceps camponoti-rufipedis]
MADSSEYAPVEFYVACNPPLTSRGVDFVIDSLEASFSQEAIEILYEPEIPWFKLLASPKCKQSASDQLGNLLLTIVEQEADLVDVDGYQSLETPIDVKIIADNPRIVPWSIHEAEPHVYGKHLDACFPGFMRSLPQKRLWRGLESVKGWTIDGFFQLLDRHWKGFGAPFSHEMLEEFLSCTISWNLKGNVLYLGSNLTSEAMDKTLETLDNLIYMASRDRRSDHLMVTEEPGDFRFCYRYLTHVGQYHSTYLLEKGINDDDPLSTAVTVRAEMRDKNGQWHSVGANSAPKKAGMIPGTMKVFGPFDRHVYEKKAASAVADLLASIAEPHESPELSVDQYSAKSKVESWREAVREAQPDAGLDQVDEPCLVPVESLIDYVVEAEAPAPGQDGDLLAFNFDDAGWGLGAEPREQPSQALDDLISLGPTPQNGGHASELDPVHLLDADDAPMMEEPAPQQVVEPADDDPCLLDEDVPPLLGDMPSLLTSDQPLLNGTSCPSLTAEKPANGFSTRGSPKSHLLKMTEASVKELAGILPYTPGIVSIELRFGRFYRKNLISHQINSGNDQGPFWGDASLMSQTLNIPDWQTHLAFSTALSACGPDMDELVQMYPPAESPWLLYETKAWYEVVCTLTEDGQSQMVVEIDAETFEFRCRGPEEQMGCLFLHCLKRPWDMQVSISSRASFHNSPFHTAVARTLAASLSVRTTREGQLAVETTEDARLKVTVDNINVRHVARYRLGRNSNSLLSVTMVRKLDKGERQGTRRQWQTGQARVPYRGTPIIWYEAALSSLKAEQMLAENRDMTVGSRASWDCERLEAEGVLDDVCRPAFGIITQMDDIGQLNDNGLRMATLNSRRPTEAVDKRRGKDYSYW